MTATPGSAELLARIELALTQAQSCIKGETPEDITFGEAEDDTFSKVRAALDDVAELRRLAAKPDGEGVICVLAIAPEKCDCGFCDGLLHLNRASYYCDKHTSVEFHIDDCEVKSPSTTGEPKR